MVSPLIIPRDGDEPVVLASLGAPTEDLDGVAAQLRAADVVIHAAGEGREVLVHRERTSDGTVLHHVLLDSLHGAEAVRCAGILLVITVRPRVRRLTARGKRRSGVLRTRTGRILGRRRHVMSAGCQRVRPTSRSSADVRVVSCGDNARVLEPLPRLPWLTPVATHGETREESAVGRGVLNRHQRRVARGDAPPVIESLGAAECPARTAEALVPDVTRTSKESGTTPFHCWSLVFA